MKNDSPVVIAIDGTSASGKSTNAKLVASKLGYTYVDTGAMFRTLAWYCLKSRIDIHDHKAVAQLCKKWKTKLMCIDGRVRLLVDGYYPESEIRTAETSAAVPHIAAVPKVREWMKLKQRDCIEFGSIVMEGRDIGTQIFPETEHKFYLDANLAERSKRREAEGVQEDLAKRDQRDSQRSTAPLMVPLGALVVNTSGLSPEQSSQQIIDAITEKSPDIREVKQH